MPAAALRTPRTAPLPSPKAWFPARLALAAGIGGNQVNSTYYNGKTYVGFIDMEGDARVAQYDHTTETWTLSPAIVSSGLAADVHDTPAVLVRSSDHKIVIAVAPHAAAHMYVAVSTNAEDVSSWGAASDIVGSLGATSCTYANLFQLSGESGKIYLFYRQGDHTTGVLCFSTSTDGGATWAAQTVLFQNTGHGCYWAVSSDDTSRIDVVCSDGNVIDGDTAASLYHMYYTGGSWHKSNGTVISTAPPLGPTDPTKIYDGVNGSMRAPYMALTNAGNPVAVWATYDPAGAGANELYWYGSCSAGVWSVHEITDTGSLRDTQFSEGGLCLDGTNIARVFVSKKVSGVWQIFLYKTSDSGVTWTNVQLTDDTSSVPADANNLRPVSPRNADPKLIAVWCSGPHFIQTVEGSFAQLRAYPNPVSVF